MRPGKAPVASRAFAVRIALAGLIVSCAVLTGGCREPIQTLDCSDCNLVLVSIDTLRADRLGVYGNSRPVTPAIDALAGNSIVFEQAVSGTYHTAESHATIFTSTLPSVHEVSNASARVGNSLDPGLATLAEALAAKGLSTIGFHGGGNVSPVFGFAHGFDRYEQSRDLSAAAEWIADHPDNERFFLFLHTYHVHDPYTPSPQSLTRLGITPRTDIVFDRDLLERETDGKGFGELRDRFWSQFDRSNSEDTAYALQLYEAEILEVDQLIGQLVDDLLERSPRTIVVITSDHGEEFGEHGKFLHDSLYQEVLHVPLLIHHPAGIRRRIADYVSLLDLSPTLLELLDVPVPRTFQGRSWKAALENGSEIRRPVIAEKMLLEEIEGQVRPAARRYEAAGIFDRLKVHYRPGSQAVHLFDLGVDRSESDDLAATQSKLREAQLDHLTRVLVASDSFARLVPRKAVTREFVLPPELDRQLRALGYLN